MTKSTTMNPRWITLLLAFLLASCANKKQDNTPILDQQKIIIEGILENGENQLVTIDRMSPISFVAIDSCRCDKNGRFKIEFSGSQMDYYALKYTEQGYVSIIAEPGDKISISGSIEALHPYTVEGSEASAQIAILSQKHKAILDELAEIAIESNQIIGNINYVEQKQILNKKYDSISASFHDYSAAFIQENQNSPAALIALYNQYGPGLPVFHPLNDLDIYRKTDSALFLAFPENDAVRSLHSELHAALQQMQNQNATRKLTKGSKAPDFVLQDHSGKNHALSDFKGKYVLLQFWASWSKPSMEENPFLENCYKSLKDDNFAILQISIDNNKEDWLNNIDTKHDRWIHLSELKHWESRIVNLYHVERIPANFLISPEGEILESDLFDDEIIKTIRKYLK